VAKTTGLIVISGLLPTRGHQYLIDFASNFADQLHVIVCIRSFEPALTLDRAEVLARHYARTNVTVHEHYADDAPQNDDGTPEFWAYWSNLVDRAITKRTKIDYLFASEHYGARFAEALGVTFIPVDIGREILSVTGTSVRRNLAENFKYILPEYQTKLSKTICMFGQESVGKTTMAKWLAAKLEGRWIHEWARPYLEEIGAEVTDEKMLNIVRGQFAAMVSAPKSLFNIRDTDLLSTIGYYKIYGGKVPKELYENFNLTKSDLYVMLNDNIPFEADPLRYGGDKRESTMQFWIDLLDEYDCKYHVVENTDILKQRKEVVEAVYDFFTDLREIEEFVRD
jgi:NadR type nicotinamide-nucleotide adenylyltransferase